MGGIINPDDLFLTRQQLAAIKVFAQSQPERGISNERGYCAQMRRHVFELLKEVDRLHAERASLENAR